MKKSHKSVKIITGVILGLIVMIWTILSIFTTVLAHDSSRDYDYYLR